MLAALFTRKTASAIRCNALRRTLITAEDCIQESPAATMLSEVDYPKLFRGHIAGSRKFAHPDDYLISDAPIKPEKFLFKGQKGRNRFFYVVL